MKKNNVIAYDSYGYDACTGQQSDTASQNSDKEFNYEWISSLIWRFLL